MTPDAAGYGKLYDEYLEIQLTQRLKCMYWLCNSLSQSIFSYYDNAPSLLHWSKIFVDFVYRCFVPV